MVLFPPVNLAKWVPFRVLIVCLCFLPTLSIAQTSMDQEGLLRTGTWSLDILTHHLHGAFCLFEEAEGAVRIEAFAGLTKNTLTKLPAVALDNLLWRQSDGWTVILSADGTGVINPWHAGWEILESYQVIYLRTMLASLDYGPSKNNAPWPSEAKILAVSGSTDTRIPLPCFNKSVNVSVRLELPLVGETPTFRQKLVSSGRGRGLEAEIVKLSVEGISSDGKSSCRTVVMRSSRRPGAFRLCEQEAIKVHYAGQDPFIPMWPLGDLLRLE